MKKHIYLTLLASLVSVVSITSCQKQDFNESPNAKSSSKAMQIYEQHKAKFATTKSANFQDVVKPLPGNFTALWEQATERQVGSDVITTIPIISQVNYLAIYPCSSGHEGHEHNHSEIAVVQKLVVIQGASDSKCYIVNITPYENCSLSSSEINANFIIGDELADFNGFVAYHELDGTVAFVEKYGAGAKMEVASQGNETLCSEITKSVKLYKQELAKMALMYNTCFICYELECTQPNVVSFHCTICYSNYNNCSHGSQVSRCSKCGYITNENPALNQCICTTSPPSNTCSICFSSNCTSQHLNDPPCALCYYSRSECNDYREDRYVTSTHVHYQVIRDLARSFLSSANMHHFQHGSASTDSGCNTPGYEYVHNLRLSNESPLEAYNKIRNWFIAKVKFYKSSNYTGMGEALHPVLDWYLPVSQRQQMLNYYSYHSFVNIFPYSPQLSSRNSDVLQLHNSIVNLPQQPSDSQIGTLLDNWTDIGSAGFLTH